MTTRTSTPNTRTAVTTKRTRREESDAERDLVGQYLSQIGATPLLSADEEVELAKRIEAGVYARALLDQAGHGKRKLTPKHARELEIIAHDGQVAKDHMVRANLRLVVSVARKFSNRGLPFLDVIQEGNLGLIRGVEKFDYAKGFKFSTYATWWIKQAIQRGLAEQTRTVRLPVHVSETVQKVRRIERDLQRMLGRDATAEEVAEEAGLTADKVVELRRVSRDPVSIDTPVGDDGESTLRDFISDTDSIDAVDLAEHQAMLDELAGVLDSLPEREASIVRLRYGLVDGHQHTLQEVADRLGVSRERVRQLEKHAMAELRTPERNEPLLAWAS